MITIDHNKCNACGTCEDICHEYCIRIDNSTLTIDYTYCSTCTQCIAVCPQQALSWDNVRSTRYNKDNFPGSEQIDELLKERRTIRSFKSEKIDRSLLEEIAGYAIYSPTHNFNMRVIIIDDEQLINDIDKAIFRFATRIYKWLYKPHIVHRIIKLITPSREHGIYQQNQNLKPALKGKEISRPFLLLSCSL